MQLQGEDAHMETVEGRRGIMRRDTQGEGSTHFVIVGSSPEDSQVLERLARVRKDRQEAASNLYIRVGSHGGES